MTREEVISELARPFDASEIKWKPASVSGNRAMALAYVDARVIQDRLDEVLGVDGWQDNYQVLGDGASVVCKLSLKIGDQWVTKMDVGGESEQPDQGDRMKAAFSDALKRAAVKFGIGRFLYRLPMQWVDWDASKRQFARQPQLPAYLRNPQQVQPAAQPKPEPAAPEPARTNQAEKGARVATPREKALAVLRKAALEGIEALQAAWAGLTPQQQTACKADKDELKKEALRHAASVA